MSLGADLQSTKPRVRRFHLFASLVILNLLPAISEGDTEIQKLMIEIRNSHDELVVGIRVKCRGHSEFSYPSTPTGLAELPLPPGIQPGDQVEIELEPGSDLAKKWTFLQPFDGRINVPSMKQRYYKVVLVQRDHLELILKTPPMPIDQSRNRKIDRFDRPSASLGKIRDQKHQAQ